MSAQSTLLPARPSIWLVGTSFVLLQFFLQLSSSVVIAAIMQEMQLSPLAVGSLSCCFYIIYTILQIPVGILYDYSNPRPILTVAALFCSLGCVLFAASHSLIGLYIGRSLVGVGSAFAFVGLTHLVRQYYPIRQFAILIGISETFSFMVAVICILVMGELIQHWGWRAFLNTASVIAILVAYLCWTYIPDETHRPLSEIFQSLKLGPLLANKRLWINGLFIGLSFSIVTVFGALWSVPFLQVKLQCTLRQASLINAMFFLGTGFSCPLFGALSEIVYKRKPLIIASCMVTALLMLSVIYLPITGIFPTSILMLLLGLCCGAYILAYPISNELASAQTLSTCAGFTNTLALATTPLLQPLIGYLLELFGRKNGYTLASYQWSLLILPLCLVIAAILVCFLPEKKSHSS